MDTIGDPERPKMRLPYERAERAGGIMVWLGVVLTIAVPTLLVLNTVLGDHPAIRISGFVVTLAALLGIADYLIFEERCRIDSAVVRFRRRSMFGWGSWTEKLGSYRGVALVSKETAARLSDPDGLSRSHWTRRKPARAVRLLHKSPSRCVTLWEFDERDFSDALNSRVHAFSEILKLPIVS